MNTISLTQYGDLMNVCCYAMDPAIKKLKFILGDYLNFKTVPCLFNPEGISIVGDDDFSDVRFKQLRYEIKNKTNEILSLSAVPYDLEVLNNIKVKDLNSLTISLAYCSILFQSEEEADQFLRISRQNLHARNKIMSRYENILELVEQLNINIDKFKQDYEMYAHYQLDEFLKHCYQEGIKKAPTIEFNYQGKSCKIYGYVDYYDLIRIINLLSDGEIFIPDIEFNHEDFIEYIRFYKVVSNQDLKLMFNIDDNKLDYEVNKLINSGTVTKEIIGNNYFIHLVDSSYHKA